MKTDIPQWVTDYNNAGYQSGAGRAVKILFDRDAELQARIKQLEEALQPFKRLADAVLIEREVLAVDLDRPLYSFNFADILYSDLKKVIEVLPQ